jgi:hypothetical protein
VDRNCNECRVGAPSRGAPGLCARLNSAKSIAWQDHAYSLRKVPLGSRDLRVCKWMLRAERGCALLTHVLASTYSQKIAFRPGCQAARFHSTMCKCEERTFRSLAARSQKGRGFHRFRTPRWKQCASRKNKTCGKCGKSGRDQGDSDSDEGDQSKTAQALSGISLIIHFIPLISFQESPNEVMNG